MPFVSNEIDAVFFPCLWCVSKKYSDVMMTSSMDLPGLNLYWCGFSCCVFSKCDLRRCEMIFSRIFDCTSSCEIGLYDVGSVGGLFGFLSIMMLAFFRALGKYPVLSVALYKCVKWIPVLFGVCFNISVDIPLPLCCFTFYFI